jgi:DNA gyrase/topoisomerase IV subunit A
MERRRKMAQLEITDKDIATVEQLHDKLWGLGRREISEELHKSYKQLIARMYESVKKEKEINNLQKKLLEDVKRAFPERTEKEMEILEKKWLDFCKKPY